MAPSLGNYVVAGASSTCGIRTVRIGDARRRSYYRGVPGCDGRCSGSCQHVEASGARPASRDMQPRVRLDPRGWSGTRSRGLTSVGVAPSLGSRWRNLRARRPARDVRGHRRDRGLSCTNSLASLRRFRASSQAQPRPAEAFQKARAEAGGM